MTATDRFVREAQGRLAAAIRRERVRQGLSMLAVAERAGLSQQMVSYFERGMRNASIETLLRLGDALGVDAGALLSEAASKGR